MKQIKFKTPTIKNKKIFLLDIFSKKKKTIIIIIIIEISSSKSFSMCVILVKETVDYTNSGYDI